MKPHSLIYPLLFASVSITGCRFGEDRTDIRGNGQGGINVKFVPNDPASEPAPQKVTTDEQTHTTQQQQQIEQLQSQLRQQDEEIRRLKGLPPTQPATQP